MNKLNVLVTGGAGFIGSHLVDELLLQGHSVLVLDNFVNGKLENLSFAAKSSNFAFNRGDILNNFDCISATKNIDVVYHLACLGVRHSLHSPFENHQVNSEGTLKILEASRINGVKRFFYISTSEIYGDIKKFPIDESGIPLPKTVYGSSKLAGENYTYSYHKCYGLDTTVLRIFNNYGPRAHHEGDSGEVIPRNIVNILNGIDPVIFGDGSITRDFFFVKDTAKVLVNLISNSNITGRIFNLGTGVEITMKDLIEKLIKLIPESNVKIRFLDDRPADVPRLWVDSSAIRKIIDIKNEVGFEVGLKETIKYYQEKNSVNNLLNQIELINWKKDDTNS